MNPEFIRQQDQDERASDDQKQSEDIERMASAAGGAQESSAQGQRNREEMPTATESDRLTGGRQLPSHVEKLLALKVEQPALLDHAGSGDREVRYPEWDQKIDDYRLNWCRVVERAAEEGSGDIVGAMLSAHGTEVSALRRFFESLRPPGLRRVPGQADGDELDVDAAVRMCAERAAGADLSDRIYVSRKRKERDVAAAFLVDVSGSTSRQLDSGRRVIDLEKEGLVLLCEALEAVGDQYALYGYSGQGREKRGRDCSSSSVTGVRSMTGIKTSIRWKTPRLLYGRRVSGGYIHFVSRSIGRPMAMSGECTGTCSSRSSIISKPCRCDCRGFISGSRREM
jgi:nitric oxide reductase activation protein